MLILSVSVFFMLMRTVKTTNRVEVLTTNEVEKKK